MKWYAIENSDSSKSTVDVILDHNTTALVAWNSSGSNADGMNEVAIQLATDTSTWVSGLNPRLITADEIAQITGNTTFNGTTSTVSEWFYFETNSTSAPATYSGNYAWLYDYTSECTSYGCNVADSSNSGYWTSTPVVDNASRAWRVSNDGSFNGTLVDNTGAFGVRPVITISKSLLK